MKQNFAQPFAFLAVKSFPTAMFAKNYARNAKNFCIIRGSLNRKSPKDPRKVYKEKREIIDIIT